MAVEYQDVGGTADRNVSSLNTSVSVGNKSNDDNQIMVAIVNLFTGQYSANPMREPTAVYYNDGATDINFTLAHSFEYTKVNGTGRVYIYVNSIGTKTFDTWDCYLTLSGTQEVSSFVVATFNGCYQGTYSYIASSIIRDTATMTEVTTSAPLTHTYLDPGQTYTFSYWIAHCPQGLTNEITASGDLISNQGAWTRDGGGTLEYYIRNRGVGNLSSSITEIEYAYHISTQSSPTEIFGFHIHEAGWSPFAPPWVGREGYYEIPCGYAGQVISSQPDVSHLEGQTVAILANGNVLEEQVVTDGTVNVSSTYSLVHIGLPYYADLETLNIEVPENEGTVQSKRLKIGNATFRIENTRGGYIGPDEDDLWEAFTYDKINQYSGDNIGELDMYTGDLRVPLGSQYSDEGNVFYRQVDPLPVTIGAIIPEVNIGGASR